MILPTTAAANDGVCMPCKGGYRKGMEESRKRYEAEKAYRETSAYRHWVWLVKQVYGDGNDHTILSDENMNFFAVNTLVGEVYNGGFDQYFHNSASDYYGNCVSGLKQIGAERSLALLLEATNLIWNGLDVPVTQMERALKINNINRQEAAYKNVLDNLDREFWKDEDGINNLLSDYRNKHRLDAGF